MLTLTKHGLYCRVGDFYIDPSKGVESAVITHGHSDHARRGSQKYFCAESGVEILKVRLGKKISVTGIPFGKKFFINGVTLSFHPAGHILGSAKVRMEWGGEVWVASGDYKRDADPTCEPFEVVPCDVFITEATFGTPRYSWNKELDAGKEIVDWWNENRSKGINSVLFAYSLGKAQRILGALYPYAKKPIYCHHTISPLNDCYRTQGIKLAPTTCLSTIDSDCRFEGEFFLVPNSFF